MKKTEEYDIWNEVLETLGFKFQEELTMWRSSNFYIINHTHHARSL